MIKFNNTFLLTDNINEMLGFIISSCEFNYNDYNKFMIFVTVRDGCFSCSFNSSDSPDSFSAHLQDEINYKNYRLGDKIFIINNHSTRFINDGLMYMSDIGVSLSYAHDVLSLDLINLNDLLRDAIFNWYNSCVV